ncbi:MAG TPA: hypothetical protein VGD80_17915 [Kofleriaceae bacterium]
MLTRAALVAAAAAACASSGSQGASGGAPGERSCGFETLGGRPGPEYVEIARIDLAGEGNFGAGRYRDTRRFTETLREMVCELGGDAVQPVVDAYGVVVRAVVFRLVRGGPPGRSDPR